MLPPPSTVQAPMRASICCCGSLSVRCHTIVSHTITPPTAAPPTITPPYTSRAYAAYPEHHHRTAHATRSRPATWRRRARSNRMEQHRHAAHLRHPPTPHVRSHRGGARADRPRCFTTRRGPYHRPTVPLCGTLHARAAAQLARLAAPFAQSAYHRLVLVDGDDQREGNGARVPSLTSSLPRLMCSLADQLTSSRQGASSAHATAPLVLEQYAGSGV